MESGPTIGCPACGAQLPLSAVERRGGHRYIVCKHCDEATEWPVDDERPPPRNPPPP